MRRLILLLILVMAAIGGLSAIIQGQDAKASPVGNFAPGNVNEAVEFHRALGHVPNRLPRVTTRELLSHLAHETGDRGAAMHLMGSGIVNSGDDIGNWPWLGGLCYSRGMVRCCYLPATGLFGSCKCYCNAGGCNWGFA